MTHNYQDPFKFIRGRLAYEAAVLGREDDGARRQVYAQAVKNADVARGRAYAPEIVRGYQFLDNVDSKAVDARLQSLREAGFDAIKHPITFGHQGGQLDERSNAILVRPTEGKSPIDALKFIIELARQEAETSRVK